MAQAIRKRTARSPDLGGRALLHLKEGGLIALVATAVFMLVALWSYEPSDPAWTHTGPAGGGGTIANKGGVVGAWFSDISLYLFGYLAYFIPTGIALASWWAFSGLRVPYGEGYIAGITRFIGFVLTLVVGAGLAWMHWKGAFVTAEQGAGIVGQLVGREVASVFGRLGGTVLMMAVFLMGFTLFTGLSWFRVMDRIGEWVLAAPAAARGVWETLGDWLQGLRARRSREALFTAEALKDAARPRPRIEAAVTTVSASPPSSLDRFMERQGSLFGPEDAVQPPIGLLDPPPSPKGGFSADTLAAMSRQVELKLMDFGIEVAVVAVHPGPVITRFELQPAPGVKAARVTSLSKDLARSLSTISVRVVEVIPGKSVIGLEIPNHQRELVSLREILGSKEYAASPSPLTLALGKDIAGKPVVVDLARMPHLLVAGTTGAGKSVALNAMILSMLYKASPRDVRLIMIDPKMLELSVYEGIPALLAPVVTDMKEAANALRWCVGEMERRYRLMAALGVRNLAGYNRKTREARGGGEALANPLLGTEDNEEEALEPLPTIVVIVDELADMMMTVGKRVEELIARLAQKARASGVHLILATQRPSVDVITGLIKANIPCRIAFQVSSRVDSRTILDQMGAESLLGHGDMLYLPPGTGVPMRVHGAFVSDQEVHKVAAFLKHDSSPDYIAEIVRGEEEMEDGGVGAGRLDLMNSGVDDLYDEAVRYVTETRRASVSGVQRKLKIGYNRAARMVEEMERSGVVGALQSNGFREVLAPPPPRD